MPGASEQSPSGEILDYFEGRSADPSTAAEIASETGRPPERTGEQLDRLVDRGFLRTKEIGGSERIWWPTRHDGEAGERPGSLDGPAPPGDGGSPAVRQRLLEQHRQLAQFLTRISITDDLEEILRQITVEARELVGAHQSVTSRTVDRNWAQAINEVSLPEKYAEYREYDTEPDGSGIYARICELNEPMRMTQAELEPPRPGGPSATRPTSTPRWTAGWRSPSSGRTTRTGGSSSCRTSTKASSRRPTRRSSSSCPTSPPRPSRTPGSTTSYASPNSATGRS